MFNLSNYWSNQQKIAGRRRIRDRGIKWEEHYHEKSAPLKKRFDREIGPGAYWRWEGHDYTTDGDYFIVVGPAMDRNLHKRFFSGIKRLPKDKKKKVFAPSGEYFSSLHGALSHATERWGVMFPRGSHNYSLKDLADVKIPRHIRASDMKIIKTAARAQVMPSAVKHKLNGKITGITQGYHDQIPIGAIFDALKEADNIVALQEDGTEWSGFLVGGAECGSDETSSQVANLELAVQTNGGLVPIKNAMLYLSWCTMPSGKYEIVSYIS